MEEAFLRAAGIAATLVEGAAVLIVFYGALESFARLMHVVVRPAVPHGERKALWRRFGVWLLLGLEFELAADIVHTVIAPTWSQLGKLAAIAVIRTFLNYFLEKDLERLVAPDEAPLAEPKA